MHVSLVKLSLETREYERIVPLIEKFILYFPGQPNQQKAKYLCDMGLSPTSYITPSNNFTTKFKHLDILEYFYYSGMIFIGLKEWERAFEALESAVTYPVKEGCSKIMVAAYKKWVLCGLMIDGKPPTLPKATSGSASKVYHIMAKPYDVFAQIFEQGTASRLKSEFEAAHNIWTVDCNLSLVFAVLNAYQKQQIRNLANVYTKISIPEIVNTTTSAETGSKLQNAAQGEALVRDMLNNDQLQASMSQSSGGPSILTFPLQGLELSEAQMKQELATTTARILALTKEIKNTDKMLTHDKEYIKFAQRMKKNKDSSGGPDLPAMGDDWNGGIDDEDIMEDYP
jgi:COP9 signalosome complex subunit 3